MFDFMTLALAIFVGLAMYSVAISAILTNKWFVKKYTRVLMETSKELAEEMLNVSIEQHEKSNFTEAM